MKQRIGIVGDLYYDISACGLKSLPGWGEDRVVDQMATSLGGSACNTARHCSTILKGKDVEVAFIGAVGDDDIGKISLTTMADDGLLKWAHDGNSPAHICKNSSTGLCIVLSGQHDRAFISSNAANDNFSPAADPEALAVLKSCSHIHIHGYFNCSFLQTPEFLSLVKSLKTTGITFSLDTQFDAEGTWVGKNGLLKDLISEMDMFLPNEIEATNIIKHNSIPITDSNTTDGIHLCKALKASFPSVEVIVKIGEKGCTTPDFSVSPQHSVEVKDTTGAGDGFDAGFLCSWVINRDSSKDLQTRLQSAMTVGNKSGGITVTRLGACNPPLTCDEVGI
eukprot:TRINITY_DN21553_c0_g1_i1.p1 TRINITY_DN21553_c0_g1~~TRINITY_DN21553_c0_g1_i1.p1  ORF type:complete len:336 (+),score=40.11 TRINITY_DN21553_c0_g1_i1:42-1049(+)